MGQKSRIWCYTMIVLTWALWVGSVTFSVKVSRAKSDNRKHVLTVPIKPEREDYMTIER